MSFSRNYIFTILNCVRSCVILMQEQDVDDALNKTLSKHGSSFSSVFDIMSFITKQKFESRSGHSSSDGSLTLRHGIGVCKTNKF